MRAAREAGRALPLVDLLARVQTEYPGAEVLEVEIEEEHGRLVYEIKLLRPGGRLAELYYDAATGQPVDGEQGLNGPTCACSSSRTIPTCRSQLDGQPRP